jgi:hypothetical protein
MDSTASGSRLRVGSQELANIHSTAYSSPESASSSLQSTSLSRLPQKKSAQKLRTQNHSCDQCRLSKRACDLRNESSLSLPSCSTCNTRGLSCTQTWLKKRANESLTPSLTVKKQKVGDPVGKANDLQLSLTDAHLAQEVFSTTFVARKFNLFLYTAELPLSQWLADGCIPYSCGLDVMPRPGQANGPLDAVMKTIHSQIAPQSSAYGTSTSFTPRSIYATCALDVFLGHYLRLRGSGRNKTYRTPNEEATINRALTYAIVAATSQYNTSKDQIKAQRQLAKESWHNARDALFSCISSQSFRITVGLIILGLVTPPGSKDGREDYSSDTLEDSAYALQQGLDRSKDLCKRARLVLKTGEYTERNFLEAMIGSVEWLCHIVTSVSVLTDTDMAHVVTLEPSVIDQLSLKTSENATLQVLDGNMSLWDQVLHRSSTFRSISSELVIDYNTPQDFLQMVFRWAASLKVLIWKAVGDFRACLDEAQAVVDYSKIRKTYDLVMSLITLWEDCYSGIHSPFLETKAVMRPMTRAMQAFSASHVSLAIIHFVEIVEKSPSAKFLLEEVYDSDHLYQLKTRSAERTALANMLRPPKSLTAEVAECTALDNEDVIERPPLGSWSHPVSCCLVTG